MKNWKHNRYISEGNALCFSIQEEYIDEILDIKELDISFIITIVQDLWN